jgi:hypothetical protein
MFMEMKLDGHQTSLNALKKKKTHFPSWESKHVTLIIQPATYHHTK